MGVTTVLTLPLQVYLWVFGLALAGGFVSYLNRRESPIRRIEIVTVAITSCFNGFMIFCVCLANEISMEFTMFSVGVVGLMGKRAWLDFERILRLWHKIPALLSAGDDDYHRRYPDANHEQEDFGSKGTWGDSDHGQMYDGDTYNQRQPRDSDYE